MLTFKITDPDGSTMNFEGRPVDNDTIRGDFSVNAWGIVRNAGSGYRQV